MHIDISYNEKSKFGLITSDYLENIRAHFSEVNPAAKIKKFKAYNHIPDRLYAITQSGKFDVGLFGEIINHIKTIQIPFTVNIDKNILKIFKPSFGFTNYKLSDSSILPRDYQEDAVKHGINFGRGIFYISTAGGKTLIEYLLINTIRENIGKKIKTLIIVPTLQLINQTYDDFIEYGCDENILTKWSGEYTPDLNKEIIIVCSSILYSEKTDLSLIKHVDLVLNDEVHKTKKGNIISKIIKNIDTIHKYGFTGSLPEEKIDLWNIIGKIGPIIYEKLGKDLENDNYVTKVTVCVLNLIYKFTPEYKSSCFNPLGNYNEEFDFLYQNEFRNNTITKICSKTDNNTLIVVDRLSHGELLLAKFKKELPHKDCYFIKGEVEVEDRESITKLMETKSNIVCVAMTSIFSTGINIKNLHYIIFGYLGKSKIRVIQTIGRGRRLHKDKDDLIIFDIADDLLYGERHLKKRLTYYKQEGFKYEVKEIKET